MSSTQSSRAKGGDIRHQSWAARYTKPISKVSDRLTISDWNPINLPEPIREVRGADRLISWWDPFNGCP